VERGRERERGLSPREGEKQRVVCVEEADLIRNRMVRGCET